MIDKNSIKKSVFAGIMIGIGGVAYLSIPNHNLGALLFSFGLITIIARGYYLYTGMIGDVEFNKLAIINIFVVLIGNIIGATIVGLLSNVCNLTCIDICQAKLSKDFITLFIQSCFCGALMYVGVSTTKRRDNIVYAIFAVVIFILCGAEHCIANVFYLTASHCFTTDALKFICVNILGNTVGAITFYRLQRIT